MSENIEHDYARTFCTPSGARVLAHLRKITIERVLGANATDAELRGLEAQRSLIHQIENLTNRGK